MIFVAAVVVVAQPCAVLFLSSRVTTGSIGSVRVADTFCATRFNNNGRAAYKTAGVSYNFTAWLSTPTSSAITRIGGAFAGCVENVNSARLADTFRALQSGTLQQPPSVDETGVSAAAGEKVLTSTRRDGTFVAGDDGTACGNWTAAASSAKSVYGLSDRTDESWSADGTSTDTCDKRYRIYCLGCAASRARCCIVTDSCLQFANTGTDNAHGLDANHALWRNDCVGDYALVRTNAHEPNSRANTSVSNVRTAWL